MDEHALEKEEVHAGADDTLLGGDNVIKSTAATKRLGLSWHNVAWIMLGDVVGTSVLTLGSVAAQLGWVWLVVLTICLFPMSYYSSVLMTRTRSMLAHNAHRSNQPQPKLRSMAEVARAAFGGHKGAGTAVAVSVYGYTVLGNASYLLVLGNSLQLVFHNWTTCVPWMTALGCAVLVPGLIGLRQLKDSVAICAANTGLILMAVGLALGSIASRGRAECIHTYWVVPGTTVGTVLGAATNLVYAYTGQWMYFEIMDEMEKPEEFPRAFLITGPIMMLMYLIVGCLTYYYGGDSAITTKGMLLENMQFNAVLSVSALFLFLHVLVVYSIKSLVLARFFHSLWSPTGVKDRSARSYVEHATMGMILLAAGFLIANLLPFFNLLLGLIGGVLSGPINFLIPITLFLAASTQAVSDEPVREISVTHKVGVVLNAMPAWERLFLLVTVVFILLTMVIGTYQVVDDIITLEGSQPPFSCHAVGAPSDPCQ